ncbi:MAG: hypothetical protein WCC60_01920 [Ilumatobacteraceae bacterium]
MNDRADSNSPQGATEPPAYETSAELLRWVPITLFSTSGTMRLDGGRLTFRTLLRKKLVFDVPAAELHSVASMTSLGLHLWHGSTRYRLSVGAPVPVASLGHSLAGVALEAATLPARLKQDRQNRSATAQWVSLLQASAGPPPPGVRVRRPWPTWTWAVGIVLTTLLIVAAITAVTLLTT